MTATHPRVILGKRGEKSPGTSPFWEDFRRRSAARARRILLPEATDPRVLSAAVFLKREGLARPVLVGDPAAVRVAAAGGGHPLDGIEILDSTEAAPRAAFAQALFERRKAKGTTPEEAARLVEDPLYWSAMALAAGRADGVVGGAVRTTADTVRAGLAGLGLAPGADIVFGAFFMECPHAAGGPRRLLLADAAVSPHPSPRALGAVGVAAAEFFKRHTGETPRVAYLSFSTLGSAEDDSVTAVRQAVAHAKKKAPALSVDGEWQADAALVDHIARQKGVPDGPAAGMANVLIFPDLNAGNIGYKLVQHLGGARAVGPFLVGLAKPMADLSRGCTDEDIVDTVALTSLLD